MSFVPPILAPPFATPPDILTVSQKDEFHIADLRSELFSFLGRTLSIDHTSIKPEIFLLADFLYYFLTRGRQTLGEEYCDVFVFESDNLTRFKKYRLALTLSLALGPYLLSRLESGGWNSFFDVFRGHPRSLRRTQRTSPSSFWTKATREYILPALSLIARIHLALFFFQGEYMSPIRRLFQAKYLLTRSPKQPRPAYTVLSYFIVAQLVLELGSWVTNKVFTRKEVVVMVPSALEEELNRPHVLLKSKCGICLDMLRGPSCPPCGHVYCYECIVEAVVQNPQCPLCRKDALPQSILCIYE